MKAAIFDLDGTLLDSMWVWDKLATNYLVSLGVEPPDNLRDSLKKLSLLEGCHYIKERVSVKKSAEEMNEDIENILDDYYANKFELKPYVLEILEELKKRSVKMCLATATDDKLVLKAFERLKIGGYFDFIQTSNAIKIGKKDPRFFQLAIERLGFDAKDIWVFEDALHCVISAKKCGLNVVGIYDESEKEDTVEKKKNVDIYIENFSELIIDDLK